MKTVIAEQENRAANITLLYKVIFPRYLTVIETETTTRHDG